MPRLSQQRQQTLSMSRIQELEKKQKHENPTEKKDVNIPCQRELQ